MKKTKYITTDDTEKTATLYTKHGNLIFDIDDIDLLENYTISATKRGYAVMCYNKQIIFLHRLLAGALPSFEVDHVDGNKFNNRKQNLRVCTKEENHHNRGKSIDSKNKFKGVSYLKDKYRNKPWMAQITAYHKRTLIGLFPTEQQAAEAYNKYAKELHGSFARLNIIPEPNQFEQLATQLNFQILEEATN